MKAHSPLAEPHKSGGGACSVVGSSDRSSLVATDGAVLLGVHLRCRDWRVGGLHG